VFLSDGVVASARADRRHPRDEIFLGLELACTRHLQLTARSLFELRGKSFVRWRATIEELSGMAALAPDGVHLDHLVEIVSPMASGRWREGSGFDRHLAVPWVLTALAGCLDTHRARLGDGQTAVEGIVAELAEFLSHEQATTSWGDMGRVAFNHVIIAYTALGSGALALLDRHPQAAGWLDRALEATRRFLDVGLTGAGVTWEGICYCGYDFKYIGTFLSGLRARGLETEIVPTGSSIEAKLRRVPVWYAHETLPRGSYLQNCNESMFDPHRAVWGLLLTFGRYEPDLCAAVWDRLVGARGQRSYGAHRTWSSLTEAMFFHPMTNGATAFERLDDVFHASEVGYLSARDSWSDDATVFAFNSGPFYERAHLHDQADNNSFTLVACGEPMIIDSGDGDAVVDAPQASSLGHNLVLVDGLGEHPPGDVTGVSGRIVELGTHADAVCVTGDATDSYCSRGYNPVRHASRSALSVRRPFPYLLVYDDIRKDDAPHCYEFIVHVPAIDESSIGHGSGATVLDPEHHPIGTIEVLSPATVSARVEEFATCSEPYRTHRLLRFATTAVNPHFVVLFRPLPATAARPETRVTEHGDRREVTLRWPGSVDTITLPNLEATARSAGARPALVRTDTGQVPFVWHGGAAQPRHARNGRRHGVAIRRWLHGRWVRLRLGREQ
jgi:hypothetical protein